MATKSADLYARIEPDVKEQAELTEAELNAELEKRVCGYDCRQNKTRKAGIY